MQYSNFTSKLDSGIGNKLFTSQYFITLLSLYRRKARGFFGGGGGGGDPCVYVCVGECLYMSVSAGLWLTGRRTWTFLNRTGASAVILVF